MDAVVESGAAIQWEEDESDVDTNIVSKFILSFPHQSQSCGPVRIRHSQ